MNEEEFRIRYLRFKKNVEYFLYLVLLPFFIVFFTFLFFSGIAATPFEDFSRWSIYAISQLVLLFGGIALWLKVLTPFALRINKLYCPKCKTLPLWVWVDGNLVLKVKCFKCNTVMFPENSESKKSRVKNEC